VPQLLSAQSL
jgi:hypothetical protein